MLSVYSLLTDTMKYPINLQFVVWWTTKGIINCIPPTAHTNMQTQLQTADRLAAFTFIRLFCWCLTALWTFSTNRLYCATEVGNISRRARKQHRHITKQWNNTINQENHKHSSAWALRRWSLTIIASASVSA